MRNEGGTNVVRVRQLGQRRLGRSANAKRTGSVHCRKRRATSNGAGSKREHGGSCERCIETRRAGVVGWQARTGMVTSTANEGGRHKTTVHRLNKVAFNGLVVDGFGEHWQK
jgi:hypothetical protein